jgi:PAS domain S-box-containing protein
MPRWLRLALIAVVYWGSHALGLFFLSRVEGISPVWPASGVALAALLVSRQDDRKAVFAVLALVTFLSNLSLCGSVRLSLGFTAANGLEWLLGALFLSSDSERPVSFGRVRDVLRLALAGTLITAISAVVGAATASLENGAPFSKTFCTWWIADGLGLLLVTPLIVSFSQPEPARRQIRWLEGLVLAIAWAGAAWVAFHPQVPLGPLVPQPYMLLPLLAWTALRLGGRGVTLALVALGAVAIASTLSHSSAFSWGLPESVDRLLTTQIYVAIAAVMSLLLAARTSEMKLLEHAARNGEARCVRAEAEARSYAESLRVALDAAGMGTWEWDPSTHRVRWSDRVEHLFGMSAGSFDGTDGAYLAAIHPEDRAGLVQALERALSGETSDYRIEHRVVWPDGGVHWLEGRGSVHRDEHGTATRMTGTVVDVTARRRQEARFRTLIENASDLIVVLNREGIIRFQSPSSLRVLGYTPQELVGRNALEFTHPDDIGAALAALAKSDEPGLVPTTVKLRLRHQDGSYHLMDCVGRSVPEEAVDGYIVINMRDITESTALQEKLRQTQRLEALGTLAGGIAHDFNNILGAMLAFTELARLENPENQPLGEYLREVMHAGMRATNLVRQILSFSRQQPNERKPISLTTVVSEALTLLRPTLPSTLVIEAHLPASLPYVLADATQMHQVVMNICTNAAQAMHGRGTLVLRLDALELTKNTSVPHPRLAPGKYLCLSITDTGHGMDAATLERVFEPFFTTKGPGAGTGLGLAVAHGIVNEHDGAIALSSAQGRGTTVMIHLPVADRNTAVPERRVSEPPVGGGERILFVDDEQALCTAAGAILERAGYRAVVYRDSEQAWRHLQREPESFALVVSDLTMPGMTGLDLASRVHDMRPELPILLTSGHAGGLTEQHLHELGISELLEKPFDYQVFTRTVARIVRRGSNAKASPARLAH